MSMKNVLEQLSPSMILETIEVTDQALKRMGLDRPESGLPGLNPHAGENGMFGDEERFTIVPAIEDAKQQGILTSGLFSRHDLPPSPGRRIR